jgi:hypothetical protein
VRADWLTGEGAAGGGVKRGGSGFADRDRVGVRESGVCPGPAPASAACRYESPMFSAQACADDLENDAWRVKFGQIRLDAPWFMKRIRPTISVDSQSCVTIG